MNEDFDFDYEIDDEFEDELADFDEGIEDDVEITLRTAVLHKNQMVALLCIKSANNGAAICRVDPREALPSVQIYDDPEAAHKWFSKSLISSKKNGWNVVYDGLPLQG
jgi:hypothetical protein